MITVSNISKSFGDVRAIDDLSFSVSDGEIVGLLGPNGAGKSTTMRILTGYLSPDQGKVTINGFDIEENLRKVQSQIGYMPENNPLYKDMLVSEIVEFSARMHHLSLVDKNSGLDFAVRATGISDVYYRPIGELSKGYKQRVGMAISLLHRPKVLILDEPSEGLDPNQRAEVRDLIKKLAKGHTIIISTHVMQEVEAVCSRLLIIANGKLVADGSPKALMQTAQTAGATLMVTMEGNKIGQHIKLLPSVAQSAVVRVSGNKTEVKIIPKKGKSVQPELMRAAYKNKWVIWKLTEEEQKLEDIFHKLTKKHL